MLLISIALVATFSTNLSAVHEVLLVLYAGHAAAPKQPHLSLRSGSTVLVTGGAGFVGYHLCVRLHHNGVRVIALDNFDPYYSTALKRARQERLHRLGVRIIEGDMCDMQLVSTTLKEHGVTHVASMAAQAGVRYSLSHPQAYVRANVECFVSLLEALRLRPSTVLVYASSSSVYGANKKIPFDEEDRVDAPSSLYAATKKANEAMAHVYHSLYGIPVTGLRFFTVYGPWGRPDMAYFSFAHRIAKGLPINVYGRGTPQRDFTYIDDVVSGVVAALALGAEEELFNLGNHRTVTLSHFIAVLEQEMQLAAKKTMTDMAPGDVLATYADIEHARYRLGYEPATTIEVGLRNFVRWYRSTDFEPQFAEDGEWNRAGPTM
jgi:UDP-glucuronate 4-epimerase